MSAQRAQAGAPPRLLDEAAFHRTVTRLAHELVERHAGEQLLLVGIRTRGIPLAQRLAIAIEAINAVAPRVLAVDAREYRDDRPRPLEPAGPALVTLDGAPLPALESSTVVLVDDVLYTGRTQRAALDALLSVGSPASVEVLVLVDRGHRELPLRATYVGKNVPTSSGDRVAVRVREVDGVDGAWLIEEPAS